MGKVPKSAFGLNFLVHPFAYIHMAISRFCEGEQEKEKSVLKKSVINCIKLSEEKQNNHVC